MYHQLLQEQLNALSLQADQPPDLTSWQRFLDQINNSYSQRAAEQDRLQAVLHNVADAILTFDENGRIDWFNRAAEQMFGYRSHEIAGHHLERLLPNPHHYQIEKDALSLQTNKQDGRADIVSIYNELTGQRQDGTFFPVAFTISQMMVQGQRQFIGIVQNISQRKQAEAELLAAKETAEAANQIKSQFLANTSHEIRTPLHAIIGLTSLLLDSKLSKDQRRYIEIAQRSSQTLLAILNDILDLSRIEAGKLTLEQRPYPLQTAVLDVVQLLQTQAVDKQSRLHVNFAPGLPKLLVGDGIRLGQVLTNLISNAIKFTTRGEITVHVNGRYLEQSTFELHIAVEDTGLGLPANYQEWLFQPFHQGPTQPKQASGTGLGLTISQRLVSLMNGRIWAENNPERGSTFHILLPSAVSEQPMLTQQPVERLRQFDADMARQLPLRILVAEDNPINQQVMLWMLQHLGYQPDMAANGMEVLHALGRQPYDLILMDLLMPEMDGRTASKIIRAELPQNEQPWIIAVTADALQQNQDLYQSAGLNDYLTKPVQPEALITALCRIPKATAASSIPSQGPIDETVLMQILGNNPQRKAELLHTFQLESDKMMEQLETAVAEQKMTAVRQLAHSLKGGCATIGLHSLTEQFRTLEGLSQSKPTAVATHFAQLKDEYQRTLTAVMP